jgi:hypothetical protein
MTINSIQSPCSFAPLVGIFPAWHSFALSAAQPHRVFHGRGWQPTTFRRRAFSRGKCSARRPLRTRSDTNVHGHMRNTGYKHSIFLIYCRRITSSQPINKFSRRSAKFPSDKSTHNANTHSESHDRRSRIADAPRVQRLLSTETEDSRSASRKGGFPRMPTRKCCF